MTILSGLLIFTIIVVVHELGHYWTARKAGIHVEEFSVGMGPRLLHFTKNGTIWSIKLFPLGGSCRMRGEDEGQSAGPGTFSYAPVGWRILVIGGGAIMNFLLALVLATIMSMFTTSQDSTVMNFSGVSPLGEAGVETGDRILSIDGRDVDYIFTHRMELEWADGSDAAVTVIVERDGQRLNFAVEPHYTDRGYVLGFYVDSPIFDAGLQIGDRIVRINNRDINIHGDFMLEMQRADGSPIYLEIERNGQILSAIVTPRYLADENRYIVGFTPGMSVGPFFARTQTEADGTVIYVDDLDWVHRESFFGGIANGFHNTVFSVRFTMFAISTLFTDGIDGLMGPLGIVTAVGGQVEQSLEVGGGMAVFWSLMSFTFLLSVNLGIINLLPLPALDGGRLVFLFLEAIRRKPINPDKEGMVHFAGIVMLMALAAVVFYNDIVRLISS
jgi:regulator of sigma E protease